MVWEQGMVRCGGQRNRLTPRNWVPEAAAPSSEGRADLVSHKGGWGQTQVAAPLPKSERTGPIRSALTAGPGSGHTPAFLERERVGRKPGY